MAAVSTSYFTTLAVTPIHYFTRSTTNNLNNWFPHQIHAPCSFLSLSGCSQSRVCQPWIVTTITATATTAPTAPMTPTMATMLAMAMATKTDTTTDMAIDMTTLTAMITMTTTAATETTSTATKSTPTAPGTKRTASMMLDRSLVTETPPSQSLVMRATRKTTIMWFTAMCYTAMLVMGSIKIISTTMGSTQTESMAMRSIASLTEEFAGMGLGKPRSTRTESTAKSTTTNLRTRVGAT